MENSEKLIEIKKAELQPDETCKIIYREKIEGEEVTNDITVKSSRPIHPDLKGTFKKLIPHLALITEQIENSEKVEDVKDFISNESGWDLLAEELHKQFDVSGITIKGTGENQGVIITGTKMLNNMAKQITIISPEIKWDDNYDKMPELRIAVSDIEDECNLYMAGKRKPDPQIEMEFEQPDSGANVSFGFIDKDGNEVTTKSIPLNKLGSTLKKAASKRSKKEADL